MIRQAQEIMKIWMKPRYMADGNIGFCHIIVLTLALSILVCNLFAPSYATTNRQIEVGETESEAVTGVPFIITLEYKNGSYVTSGDVTYRADFNFSGSEFLISDVNSGSFANYTMINETAIEFTGPPLSKGQNHTAVVVFTFEDGGLAETKRNGTLNVNVTSEPIAQILERPGISFSNQSGTFLASPLVLTNSTTYYEAFREPLAPVPLVSSLISGLSVSPGLVTPLLSNATSMEIADLLNAFPQSERADLVSQIPPISPSEPISSNASIPFDSSITGVLLAVVDLGPKVLKTAYDVYLKAVPCIQLDELKHLGGDTNEFTTSIDYSIRIVNCSAHLQLTEANVDGLPAEAKSLIWPERFDIQSNSTEDAKIRLVIPQDPPRGIHYFDVVVNVLFDVGKLGTYVVSFAKGSSGFVCSENQCWPV